MLIHEKFCWWKVNLQPSLSKAFTQFFITPNFVKAESVLCLVKRESDTEYHVSQFLTLVLTDSLVWHNVDRQPTHPRDMVLYSHEKLYIQKHIQHNNDERTQFFRKIYPSLYWKGCVWEGVGDRTKTATYWPPTLLAITAFLSRSGLLNRGLGGPASAGTCFSFQHLLSNWSKLPVARVI